MCESDLNFWRQLPSCPDIKHHVSITGVGTLLCTVYYDQFMYHYHNVLIIEVCVVLGPTPSLSVL